MSAFPLPYVITVSDGLSIRTVHPASLGRHREMIEGALADIVLAAAPPKVSQVATPSHPTTTTTMTQREIATVSGYSGNACASCGSFAMKRTGTCETCEGCGSTSGGCS